MRLHARRMRLATTWSFPKWRLKSTRMRSASPRSTVRRTIASARYVRDAIRGEWYRGKTGSEARVTAVDDEIRSLLTQGEAALGPFYGMMLYHLGLDAARGRGGKRLRPLLCALVFEALGGDGVRVTPVGAAIELLHNFTLIHDDIEDQDPRRHHRPTVWSVWGVSQAINAGDGMYAMSRLAIQRLRKLGFPAERILDFASLMDQTCVRVCEGQFLDISFESRTDITAERYRVMAARKNGA